MRQVIAFTFATLCWIAAPLARAQVPAAEAVLATVPSGTRIGLLVVDADGREIVAVNPDQRFIPASNTKLFTTAAAFMTLGGLDKPDTSAGARVHLEGRTVVLSGHGDARLSSARDCVTDCLASLADAIAVRHRRVGDVVGDATFLPDFRWSLGMSWNNLVERSGTAVSALSLDDNEVPLLLTPTAPGEPPRITVGDYYRIDNRARTVANGEDTLAMERLPFERVVRLTGNLPVGAGEQKIGLGIDDPAHYAAWTLARMLRERGVRVRGTVNSRYRPAADVPKVAQPALATALPAPLAEDLRRINKVSQNLHADLLLRRVGRVEGDGSPASGLAVVERMLTAAGAPRASYDLFDGSGMSTYNRVSPRAAVRLLQWTARQPWGEAYRATLPVGGFDGTLARRFKGTPLQGRIFAKTGSLNGASALSGWMIARSGRMLTFSILANDMPAASPVTPIMDAALLAIAAAN